MHRIRFIQAVRKQKMWSGIVFFEELPWDGHTSAPNFRTESTLLGHTLQDGKAKANGCLRLQAFQGLATLRRRSRVHVAVQVSL
jgi:hypothetical protein